MKTEEKYNRLVNAFFITGKNWFLGSVLMLFLECIAERFIPFTAIHLMTTITVFVSGLCLSGLGLLFGYIIFKGPCLSSLIEAELMVFGLLVAAAGLWITYNSHYWGEEILACSASVNPVQWISSFFRHAFTAALLGGFFILNKKDPVIRILSFSIRLTSSNSSGSFQQGTR